MFHVRVISFIVFLLLLSNLDSLSNELNQHPPPLPPPSLWPRVGGYSILILLQAYLFLPLKMMEEYVDFHVLKSTIPSVLSF